MKINIVKKALGSHQRGGKKKSAITLRQVFLLNLQPIVLALLRWY